MINQINPPCNQLVCIGARYLEQFCFQ